MAKRRKAEYKPLLYTTTLRNPERCKVFLNIIKKYDGQILTHDTMLSIEKDLLKIGWYRPMKQPRSVKSKWASTQNGEFAETALTDGEAERLLAMNPQNHKEAGFDRGWESRFQTHYAMMRTLGFVYYNKGQRIELSETGNKLAESIEISIDANQQISSEFKHPEFEQAAFLQAFAKQQRCNPFIRELNDNIPLILLLQVIKLLNSDPDYNHCGISYKELPLLIFWKDNDANSLYQRIKKLRNDHRYSPSDEVIEEICVGEILGGDFKAFKTKSIVAEYPDDFVRKMRMTGLITFRGGGRFIDINHAEDKKIDYIIEHYSKYKKYTDERAYFDYMSSIDDNLFQLEAHTITKTEAEQKLIAWTEQYDWATVKSELAILSARGSSKDPIMKFIPAPTRLEFLTAIAIKSQMPNVTVIPNYSCDDEGLPTSTAGGNKGDIECYEYPYGVLVEVTMVEGRTQFMMEMIPIHRHFDEFRDNEEFDDAQCIFIAPSLHADTFTFLEFRAYKNQRAARPYVINDFVDYLENHQKLYVK